MLGSLWLLFSFWDDFIHVATNERIMYRYQYHWYHCVGLKVKSLSLCTDTVTNHPHGVNYPAIQFEWPCGAARGFSFIHLASCCMQPATILCIAGIIVRRAGLLWSQQDFEWRWSVPLFKCLTVLEFSFILFDLCLLITFFNFIMNYVPIVTFWIFTYHKIWILSIMFCFIWSHWIIYFLACLEVSWRVVS